MKTDKELILIGLKAEKKNLERAIKKFMHDYTEDDIVGLEYTVSNINVLARELLEVEARIFESEPQEIPF